MKYVIALCLFGLTYAANPACQLKADPGPCKAFVPSYYYDAQSGECRRFIYGGCQGNDNRFPTEAECMKACNVQETNFEICHLEPERGLCLAYMPRYYYNAKEGRCEKFIYGGCQGNPNNFKTQEECEARCAVESADVPVCEQKPETGMCRGFFPRYYYDKESGKCARFVYGGCGGNENNFQTEEECLQRCSAKSDVTVCEQKAETGLCKGYFPRYYFDRETGKCTRFIYGGCGGNQNNFKTEEECLQICAAHSDVPVCEQDAEPGNCLAYMPRYYYDKKSGKCKVFVYGGCGGNDNRFVTKEECEDTCQVVEKAESICELEAETGPCFGYFPRYFFNKKTGRCEKFVYGGCQGNDNNFKSVEECENECPVQFSENVCEQEKVTGPCRAYFPRYFFNKETGHCERFIYGGCKGNGNNFETVEECQRTCGAF